MRWLFVGVVALNLLYFGWRFAGTGQEVDAEPDAEPARVFPQPLALLEEGQSVPRTDAPGDGVSARQLDGCPAVGPWSSAEADAVAKTMVASGVQAAARSIDLKGVAVYWVYLPPLPDRAQAMKKLRELQSRGIDSFVVAGGADANAIALGTFTARDSALGVQLRLKTAGYAAEIREQRRDVTQTWVVMADPAAQGYWEHLPAEFQSRAKQMRLPCR